MGVQVPPPAPRNRARIGPDGRVELAAEAIEAVTLPLACWREMQITETNNEGLKRTLKVVVGADELGQRFNQRLDEIKDRVQLKGFRKGKVPVPHLKKMYGPPL